MSGLLSGRIDYQSLHFGWLWKLTEGDRLMRHFMIKASALVLLTLCLISVGWAQKDNSKNKKDSKDQGATSLDQQKPGEAPAGGPAVSKDELAAYKGVYDTRGGDPAHIIEVGEAFLAKYPTSIYAGAVYSELTSS
jgi:hypothetical protein